METIKTEYLVKKYTDNMDAPTLTFSAFIKNAAYFPALLIGLSPESFMILTVFLILDFFLGVVRAITFGGMQAFKSWKLVSGIISKFLVLTVPLIVVWAGRGAGFDFTLLGQWGIGMLVLSQAYSILGHINAIRSKEDKTEWDAVSFILASIRAVLEQVLKDGHSKEEQKP